MRRLPDSYYLGSFCFAPSHYILHSTAAIAAPSTADATMGDATTPDRATTPEVAVTTDSSDQGTPPPQTYNESNYRFNHSTPGNTAFYNPATVMDQLHITEYQTTTTPPLPDNTPYTQFFTAYTGRVSTTLTTTSNSTFATGLHTTHSLHPWRPPHCSAFHYLKQPTSTTITRLHSTLRLATTPKTLSSNYRLDNNYS